MLVAAIDGAFADLQLFLGKRDDLLLLAGNSTRSVLGVCAGRCGCAGLIGLNGTSFFMDIVRPVLIKNAHDGIGVHFIDRHCDDGMPGSEACIVGRVFLRLVRLFADQPARKSHPDARADVSCILGKPARPGVVPDLSGRYLGVFEITNGAWATEGESKAATIISVMQFSSGYVRHKQGGAYERM